MKLPSHRSKLDFQRVINGVYVSSTGGLYETSKKEVEPDTELRAGQTTSNPWARWGKDNNYPQRLIDAVMADPAAVLLEKRAAMHWGKGMMFCRKKVDAKGNEIIEYIPDEQVPSDILDFMWMNDWPNFQQGIIADFEWWHAFHVEYITANNGKVLRVNWVRTKDQRPQLKNPVNGKIENYYVSGKWPDPIPGEYREVPAFSRFGGRSGIYRHQLVSIDKDYFPQPAWHGITRWLYIAQKIPRWILANIDNSINLKYHVKIPISYFLQRHPLDAYNSAEERNAAIQKDEQETYQRVDQYLAGEQNVSKAFYSKFANGEDGKALPGWEIVVLDNPIKDEAWLRAYGTASMAISSGMAMSPSISGQILPNGLGSGSGSDLREQFNFYMQVMTSIPRQTTLEPFEMVKRLNGWPKDIHLCYRDVVLQSVDQNKSGYATSNEQDPTTDHANPMAV